MTETKSCVTRLQAVINEISVNEKHILKVICCCFFKILLLHSTMKVKQLNFLQLQVKGLV